MSRLPQLVRALLPGAILFASSAAWAAPYGATYSVGPIAPFAEGEVRVISVTVTNTGSTEWTYDTCKDQTFFGLAYHWDGPVGIFDGQRSYIPQTVKPGESITLPVPVEAPPLAGNYTLRFDMVEDKPGGNWFSLLAEPAPTQNVALAVGPKPAAGKITGIAFDYLTAAPGLASFKVIPVGNDCPYDVDFGDGQTATDQEEKGSAGVFHTYAKVGTVTVTVKAKAPCTGTPSQKLSVVSIAGFCEIFPILLEIQGSVFGFPGLLASPPQISSLDAGYDAGWSAVAMGSSFGKESGALEAEGDFGPKYGHSLSLKIVAWNPAQANGFWPDDLVGVRDQTIRMRVVSAGGLASEWVETAFRGKRTVELIPAFLAPGNCENDTACTKCGNHSDDDCNFREAQGTISASHISKPVWCGWGGGSGNDTWTINLKNGWKYYDTQVGETYTWGSEFTPCYPALGSTSFTCTIPWKVEACGELFYSINLFAIGPVGVPMS